MNSLIQLLATSFLAVAQTQVAPAQPADAESAHPDRVEVARGPEAEKPSARSSIPANFSFVPGFSVASLSEPPLTWFGLNVIAGRLGALHGFELGSVANLEVEEMHGLQVAGVANVAGGEVRGLQVAGACNYGGSLSGAQIAGAINTATGEARGLQVAGAVNVADELAGAQIAGVNLASAAALQLGGVNVTEDSALQIGGVNVGSQSRLQLGGVNLGGEAPAQIGGANWAKRTGFQLGGVNVAEESGVSIGGINIGRRAKAPIGALNLYKEGYHAVSVWGSDLTGMTLGIKLGGEHTYSVFGFGARPGEQRFTAWAAYGVHLTSGAWFLDTDAGASSYYDRRWVQQEAVAATLRLVLGRQLWSSFSVVAGPTLNVITSWNGRDLDLAVLPQAVWHSGQTTVRLYPGFVFGLQI